MIRMRDDCKPFNITEYYRLIVKNRDPEKHIGFPIVMKLSEEVKYSYTFGANNLVIRL